MYRRTTAYLRNETGQGTSEYIIIVALIAIAAISIISSFGQNIRALFSVSANAVGGNTSQATTEAGGTGTDHEAVKKGLDRFGINNDKYQ
jgi:pilus assembly protein Flp/PilA